jgi:pimeloyl-ACP methyl ester carboxylesterase
MIDHTLNAKNLEINGVNYYLRDSDLGKDCVLLLHGMPDDGTVWKYQISELLKQGYRVLCPDMLGYGLTDKPIEVERYKSTAIASDLVHLLDILGLDKVHCIAHDWGGMIGWELAIAFPARLKSFVTMTIGHPLSWFEDSFKVKNISCNWYTLFHLNDYAPEVYRAGNGRLLREVLQSHPDKEKVVENLLQPGTLETMLNWDKANPLPEAMIAYLRGDFNELPPVTVPTFGIAGANDELMRESHIQHSEKFVKAEWRYECLEDAGHWLMLEQPEKTNQLLLDWLKKHSSAMAILNHS